MINCGQIFISSKTTTDTWPKNIEEKVLSLINCSILPINEKAKTKASEKCLFEVQNKDIMNRPALLYEMLLVNISASKDQIKKLYHKMSLLTKPGAGAEKEFFRLINQAFHFRIHDAAR